jgi:transposase-like protein
MPRTYPAEVRHQVIELARSGTKVAQLAATFGMSDATIYNWLKQDKVDRGEIAGLSTEEALDLAAAKRRIKQPGTPLHRGTLGNGRRAAIAEIKSSYREMIEGWRGQ